MPETTTSSRVEIDASLTAATNRLDARDHTNVPSNSTSDSAWPRYSCQCCMQYHASGAIAKTPIIGWSSTPHSTARWKGPSVTAKPERSSKRRIAAAVLDSTRNQPVRRLVLDER